MQIKNAKTGLTVICGLVLAAMTVSAPATAQSREAWMSTDVSAAWARGYKGQGVSISVVDDFINDPFTGNLTGRTERKTHGRWTTQQASLIAPRATMYRRSYFDEFSDLPLRSGLDVINLSYGITSTPGSGGIDYEALEDSIINYAQTSQAVVVKAAGNESVRIGGVDEYGEIDYLNVDLIGAESAIFVGALTRNGKKSSKARLASYSNFAGSNTTVQRQFLVVGVDESRMKMAGTSFGAPIVSGYAAILGSKFKSATPDQIVDQLLSTARKDTISNYRVSVHGQGEASLSRALAPSRLD
jgi:subtilisin family serine protease